MSQPSPFRIVFVCTGNTCRSPLAEALAREELRRRGWGGVEVASAGTSAIPGSPISEGSLRVGAEIGLDLSGHRARLLDESVVADADVLLTMSPHHRQRAAELGGAERTELLTTFAGTGDAGVPDPFGADDHAYRATREALTRLIRAALDRLAPVLDP